VALALPDRLVDAIREARSITAWGGRKRQSQYVGKLMRDVDPEPIRKRLDLWKHGHDVDTAHQHALEEWRDILSRPWPEIAALITDADEAAVRLRQSSPFAGVLTRAERGTRRRQAAARLSRTLPRAEGARRRR
jgi:ribosomal 50S subunit-associated protein YjgA (DUF615 family)